MDDAWQTQVHICIPKYTQEAGLTARCSCITGYAVFVPTEFKWHDAWPRHDWTDYLRWHDLVATDSDYYTYFVMLFVMFCYEDEFCISFTTTFFLSNM